MTDQIAEAATTIRESLKSATQGLVDRETLIDLIVLAAVAGEHLLVIGPPGTAKSAAVRRVSQALGGNYFEYLLGRFTEPSELFGPVDIKKLREGTVETATEGMLPEAEIAFLDEVFLASTAVLNTLLGLLNERKFRRGHTQLNCPLRVCVAASNHIPEDELLSAFADRFLLHCFVEPVSDSKLHELLSQGWSVQNEQLQPSCQLANLDLLTQAARNNDMSAVIGPLSECITRLRKEGILLSDRRIVKSMSLISAAACLRGSTTPDQRDLWPLIFAVPTEQGQEQARECLRPLLGQSENATLGAAAELASLGPKARAFQLNERAQALFAKIDGEPTNEQLAQLEVLAKEIAAGFSAQELPSSLHAVQLKLIELLT